MVVKVRAFLDISPGTTGTWTLTVSGIMGGDTPKAALLFANGPSGGSGHATLGMGLTDGTVDYACAFASEHNKGTSDTVMANSDSLVLMLMDANQGGQSKGTRFEASFTSFSADTLTLNIDKNEDSEEVRVTVVFFGGADLDAAATVMQLPDSASADQTFTHNLGHAKSQIHFFMFGPETTSAPPQEEDNSSPKFGVATWDGAVHTARTFYQVDLDNQGTTQIASQVRGSPFDHVLADPTSASLGWTIASIDSNSIEIGNSGDLFRAHAGILSVGLASNEAYVEIIDSPDTAASDWVVTAPVFQPQFIGMIINKSQSAGRLTNDESESFAFYHAHDPNVEAAGQPDCVGWASDDAAGTSVTNDWSSTSLRLEEPDATAIYDFTTDDPTFTSTGFTFESSKITTASATTHKWLLWAIEEDGGPGGVLRPPLKPFRHNLLR
jgi:hypothetical protein